MLTIHQVSKKLCCNRDKSLKILSEYGIDVKFAKTHPGRGTWYCDIDMDKVVEIRNALKAKSQEDMVAQQNESAKLLISLLDKIDYAMVSAASQRAA